MTAVRFDLNPPSRQQVTHSVRTPNGQERVSMDLMSLPMYAVCELGRVLDEVRDESGQLRNSRHDEERSSFEA